MLLESLTVDRAAFEAGTGWELKPEGACRGEVCVPLADPVGDTVDVVAVADQLGLPLVSEPGQGVHALGPWSGNGRALATAEAPELELPDLNGETFSLSSLRGTKVLLVAWAPY